jgi:hypothetical protein
MFQSISPAVLVVFLTLTLQQLTNCRFLPKPFSLARVFLSQRPSLSKDDARTLADLVWARNLLRETLTNKH